MDKWVNIPTPPYGFKSQTHHNCSSVVWLSTSRKREAKSSGGVNFCMSGAKKK